VSDHSIETDRSAYGPGAIALWVLLMLNLAWFVPYAVITGTGIMQAIMRSPAAAEAGLTGPAGAGYAVIPLQHPRPQARSDHRGGDPRGV